MWASYYVSLMYMSGFLVWVIEICPEGILIQYIKLVLNINFNVTHISLVISLAIPINIRRFHEAA